MNFSDPTGLCVTTWFGCIGPGPANGVSGTLGSLWNDIGGKAVSYVYAHRTEFEVGAGIALGVAAAATGVGAVVEAGLAAGVEGDAALAAVSASNGLGFVSLVTGLGASALDANSCFSGDAGACVGMALGGVTLLTGGAGEIGVLGLQYGWITKESLPDAVLFGVSGFGAVTGIAGSIFDSVYGMSTLLQGGRMCGS